MRQKFGKGLMRMMFSLAQMGARRLGYQNEFVRGFHCASVLHLPESISKDADANNNEGKKKGRKGSKRKSGEESSSARDKDMIQEIDAGTIHLRLASHWTAPTTRPTLYPAVISAWRLLKQQHLT